MAAVSYVSAGLRGAPELHVLGALVSCVAADIGVDPISLAISLVDGGPAQCRGHPSPPIGVYSIGRRRWAALGCLETRAANDAATRGAATSTIPSRLQGTTIGYPRSSEILNTTAGVKPAGAASNPASNVTTSALEPATARRVLGSPPTATRIAWSRLDSAPMSATITPTIARASATATLDTSNRAPPAPNW